MRVRVETSVRGITCSVVAEKNESTWNAVGIYRGEPVTTKGARSWSAAVTDWRQRAEKVAKPK